MLEVSMDLKKKFAQHIAGIYDESFSAGKH